jgi:hypothetical protein
MRSTVTGEDRTANQVHQWLEALDRQRRALKMPLKVVAQRAGLSRSTVCRVLIDKRVSSHLDHIVAIARVVGVQFELRVTSPDDVVESHIKEQARQLVRMVQGTMALEAQGITNADDLSALESLAADQIRRIPKRKLWGNQ